VPNLTTGRRLASKSELTAERKRPDLSGDEQSPGHFDLNVNRMATATTHRKVRKACRWFTVEKDDNYEDKNVNDSVDEIETSRNDGNSCLIREKSDRKPQQRQRSRSAVTVVYKNNTKLENQPLARKTPVRPSTSQATRRHSTRKDSQINDGFIDQEQVTLRNTETTSRGLSRGDVKVVHNEVHTTSISRPLSSRSSSITIPARFLCVSEAVLATQKLIKSYRRQQAIEKMTDQLEAK
jgi:hypothetical protein